MNSVFLVGRLTKDVDFAYTQSSTAVANFTLAIDRPKRNGEDQGADFIKIVVWGKQAESCDRFLSKGRQVAVLGRIQTGSYEKDGRRIFTTDVVADRVEFLGGSGESNDTKVEKIKEQVEDVFGIDTPFHYVDDGLPF